MSVKALSTKAFKTPQFVFLLGRPGSGKTHFFEKVASLLSDQPARRIDDFPKLQALAAQDDAKEAAGEERQFTRKSGRNWLASQAAYETVLRDINAELRETPKNAGFVFVEFARWDMVRSIEENFSDDVLDRSFLTYMYCPMSICIRRNAARSKATHTTVHPHEVPPDRLNRYREDDHDVLDQLRVPYIVIDNHLDDTKHLDLEAEKILRVLGVIKDN
jgi:tRNA uridine 5-carbamoylmethylation protein Kti12